jgi:hypothetical protein
MGAAAKKHPQYDDSPPSDEGWRNACSGCVWERRIKKDDKVTQITLGISCCV